MPSGSDSIASTRAAAEPRRSGPGGKGVRLAGIRLDEVLVLQGPPLMGAAFSAARDGGEAPSLALFVLASCCLVAHVFALNDWAEAPARSERLWIGLLAASIALFSLLEVRTLVLALAIAGLSALYSAPGLDAKGIPILSSSLHLAGGQLHFLLGYSLFSRLDATALALGSVFSLTFTAGHLIQEIRDHEEDLGNAVRTNAVAFGKVRAFAAAVTLFLLALGLLFTLSLMRIAPRGLAPVVPVLCLLFVVFSRRAFGERLDADRVRIFQWRYRALFAVIGVVTLVSLLGRAKPGATRHSRDRFRPEAAERALRLDAPG